MKDKLLPNSMDLLNKTQQIAHLGSWVLDHQTGQLLWSDELYRIFGFRPQEFQVNLEIIKEYVHPDDQDVFNNAFKSAGDNDQDGYEFEYRILNQRSGEILNVFEKCENIRNDSGRIVATIGVVQDITKLKIAENALRESQSLLTNIINSTPDIIYVKNNQGKYTLFNFAAEKASGLKAGDVLGKDDYFLFNESEAEIIIKGDRKVIEGNNPVTYEENVSHSDGKQLTYLSTKGPLFDKNGKTIGLFGIARDISKRKQIEKALLKSEEQFRTIVSNMGEGFGFVNTEEIFVLANKAGEEIFGVGPGELTGKCLSDLIPSDQLILVKEETKTRTKGNKSVYELEIIRPDGEKRNIMVTAVPYFENEKQFIGTYGVFRDITEHKKSELKLRESEEKFRHLIEFAVDGILTGSKDGYILDANSYFCQMSGRCRAELIGQHITTVLAPRSIVTTPLRFDLLLKGEIVVNEREIIWPDGKKVDIEMRTKMMPDSTYQAIFRDISIRKKSDLKIKQQNQELINLNADKDLFMSIVGHDLKSPFNSLLGLSDLLKENIYQYDIAKIENLVDYINQSARNAYNLLESLLMWSRSQSGKIPYEPLRLNLNDVCMVIISELKIMSDTKNITLKSLISGKLIVFADVDMLKTVLRNLIGNAVKFTHAGGNILINATKKKTKILISISDNGVGIEPNLLTQLFDVSHMNSTKGTQGEGGTGLGLLLCKGFIEKHNGEIWVESELGKGSVFKFTLPVMD